MKNYLIVVAVIIVGLVVFLSPASPLYRSQSPETEKILAIIHKSPTCGCCGVYASYMKKEGYKVDIKNVADLSEIKKSLGIPYELESCHTTEVGGYVVEGHIPEDIVEKLLTEKPDIKGIGMAGMPSGSPGMPGPKTEDFVVYEINYDGSRGEVFIIK